jgi:hypothetical protein
MTIRLRGTRQEVADAVGVLLKVFQVVAITGPYLDRGASTLVRMYLEIRL